MNGQGGQETEILARCGLCDYISYHSAVREHVRLIHENGNNNNSVDDEHNTENFSYEDDIDNTVENAASLSSPGTSTHEESIHHWSDNEIKLLLSLYADNRDAFDGKKFTNKCIWQKISSAMTNNNCPVSWEQCDNKFKNLKKTYKKVVDNNSKTGRGKITFKYYEQMDQLFNKNPEINPIAECASMDMESPSASESNSRNDTPVPEKEEETPKRKVSRKRQLEDEEPAWFKRYREDAERRHHEKMDLQKSLVSVLERCFNK